MAAPQQQQDQTQAIIRTLDSPNLKAQIARALPTYLNMERFLGICLKLVQRNPAIKRCEALSIVGSVVEASQLGLELDPVLGHGYLIPRRSKKLSEQYNREVTLCTFMPGYRGFVHLMRNSGIVTNVNAELVLKDEEFHVNLGTERSLVHVPNFEHPDRAKEASWRGAYATVLFSDGSQPDFEFLPATEINERRKRSEAANSGPWVTDTAAMWKKTVIRAIAKRMPLSPQNRKLEQILRTATLDELRENEEYREKEPMAPALELPEESIDLSAAAEEATAQREPEKKAEEKKERIRPKSGKKDEPKAEPVEFITAGQINNLMKFATEEKKMTVKDLLEVVGSHGHEKLEAIPKKDYVKIWTEIGSR